MCAMLDNRDEERRGSASGRNEQGWVIGEVAEVACGTRLTLDRLDGVGVI